MEQTSCRIGKYQVVKNFFIILLTFCLSFFFTESYALVFNIVPKGELPTSVPAEGSRGASYTVTNNTGQTRNNNFVKYLPPNVSIAKGGCANNFNLAPHGQPGDSCVLNLNITGPVSSADPDPHHHLFVCFPEGKTCAGTNSQLNVKVVKLVFLEIKPVSATIRIGQTKQYKAIGHYEDGSKSNITGSVNWNSSNTDVATINKNGLATGVNVGTTNITAKQHGIKSNNAVLNVTGFVWVTNHNSGSVFYCPLNADGTLGACVNTNMTNTYLRPGFMNLNNTATIAYVASTDFGTANNGSVLICPINPNGTFGTCDTAATGTLSENFGITLNPANTFAYVSEFNNDRVLVCPVDGTGALGTCVNAGGGAVFNQPFDIAFNPEGTIAFVTNVTGTGPVLRCTINPSDGTFDGTCTDTGATVSNNPQGIALNKAGNLAWITHNDASGTILVCSVNSSGAFSDCQTANSGTLSDPVAIVLNFTETFAYVAGFAGSEGIYRCPINADGTFSGCVNIAASGGANPFGLAINH